MNTLEELGFNAYIYKWGTLTPENITFSAYDLRRSFRQQAFLDEY